MGEIEVPATHSYNDHDDQLACRSEIDSTISLYGNDIKRGVFTGRPLSLVKVGPAGKLGSFDNSKIRTNPSVHQYRPA